MPGVRRYGCFDRAPLADTVTVRAGWRYFTDTIRIELLREIPNPMTRDCQYSKTTDDARCVGCKWRAP